MGQRVLILSAGVGSGHNMAARAVEASLRRDERVAQVKRLDVLESTSQLYKALYDDAYFALVESVPWLVGWGYDANDPPFRLGSSITVWDRINTSATVRAIKKFRPDVIVCTHFLPTRLVSLLLNRGALRTKLVTVATDYDFQGLWLTSPFHHFFVARDETRAFMIDLGVPADRLSVTGIPVRPELAEPAQRDDVLRRFELRPDRPILLISAGAAGGAYTESIVRQTLRMKHDFQAVVVCGRNDQLKRQVELLLARRGDRYRVLGYTKQMGDLMKVATLFVGKPGGLSSSECMAVGLPMVLIKPIPGQEDRNSDYLLEEGAAVRCNYDPTVGYKIDSLLADPDRIQRMAAAARRLGRADAAAQVVSIVLAEQDDPVWISQAAQKSILAAAEQGIATADLEPDRRTLRLDDPATGRSAGVIARSQLHEMPAAGTGRAPSDTMVSVSAAQVAKMRRRRTDPDLHHTLRRIMGDSADLMLRLVP